MTRAPDARRQEAVILGMQAIAVCFAAAAWLARIIIEENILSRSCCMARRQNARTTSSDDGAPPAMSEAQIFVVLQLRLRGILSIGSGCFFNGVLTRGRT
ncbi:hypothetical protein [Mesorhizobium sp. B1-1-8]|uniref:hypothetical protein n=1 Tax=Mesorhizobium sp. B1-1-8 TaxID=2589976 RepID=UPI0015E345B6|nr:hypothetical protein [Mesorhizobium sp. B1-1-8]UCI07060.1 hypothetical protein FJ974_25225 [Mesorhizobium sp. B1-1-8]